MDLKQIEYFVRVAELGSFTKASIQLDVAQPALSRQVRLLEVELGHTLLRRNGRGVSMTESGRLLLEHGRGLLHQIQRIHEDMSHARSGLVGKVAVGMPPSLTRVLTVPLTKAFRDELPHATLSLHEGLLTAIQDHVLTGSLDVALLYNIPPSTEIDQTAICKLGLYLVQARASASTKPITAKQLAKKPLIIPSRPNAIRAEVDTQLARLGLRPKITFEVNAIAGLLDLVAEGMGYAVLPKVTTEGFNRAQEFDLRLIEKPRMYIDLCWAVSSSRPISRVQRHMIQLLESKVRELVDSESVTGGDAPYSSSL